jgi:hypothetical protein
MQWEEALILIVYQAGYGVILAARASTSSLFSTIKNQEFDGGNS